MKRFTGTTLSLCLCLAATTAFAQSFLEDPDVVFLDAAIYSEAGDVLSLNGPYMWAAQNWIVGNVPPGNNLRMEITLSDADGNALYVGSADGLTLMVPPPPPPPGPFPPPPPPPPMPLSLFSTPDGIVVAGFAGTFLVLMESVLPPLVEVAVDIRPFSHRNPFNMRSHGVLPIVIMGASDFNVRDIDPASLLVAGVVPWRMYVYDIAGNDDARPRPDGNKDLVVFVSSRELAAVLGDPEHRSVVEVDVVGQLFDGTALAGFDTITVLNKKVRKPRTPRLRNHRLKKSRR